MFEILWHWKCDRCYKVIIAPQNHRPEKWSWFKEDGALKHSCDTCVKPLDIQLGKMSRCQK